MKNIFKEIEEERKRQDAKFGEQSHQPIEWVAILGEEFGEVSKAALEQHFDWHESNSLSEYRKELIQVAAVAVAMVQDLDKNRKAGVNPDTARIINSTIGFE